MHTCRERNAAVLETVQAVLCFAKGQRDLKHSKEARHELKEGFAKQAINSAPCYMMNWEECWASLHTR
jgi:hypothetical protein